jgi:hypothetical protein
LKFFPSHKTAFITKYGQFEHVKLAFGLCNSPATFSRVIQLVLQGLAWKECLAYLDDIIVLGKNFKDHLDNLYQVLERFRRYNLKLKPKKCKMVINMLSLNVSKHDSIFGKGKASFTVTLFSAL